MSKTECITENPLYQVLYHELLSKAAPGRPTRQAPRMLVAMLRSIERLVVNEGELPYVRLYSWWTLLRFDDHRGIEFASVRVSQQGLQARLTRSKTTGSDKTALCRPVVVDSISYVSEPLWLEAGWKIMKQIADFERDYLMPAPSQNFRGARRMELRYDAHSTTAHGILDPPIQAEPSCRVVAQHCSSPRISATTWADGVPKEVTVTQELRSSGSEHSKEQSPSRTRRRQPG